MNLGQLLELHECGAINVDNKSNENIAVVGGMELSNEQCKAVAANIGWLNYDKPAYVIIDKTNKFMRGLRHNIAKIDRIEKAQVTFQNMRRQNTEKYIDRIKIVCDGKLDLTILYGMPGVGGAYGIYSSINNFSQPVFGCRNLKQVGEYIDSII